MKPEQKRNDKDTEKKKLFANKTKQNIKYFKKKSFRQCVRYTKIYKT